MTGLTLSEKERYFKNQKKIGKVVIGHIKKRRLILFGQKATNRQLPKDLRKNTEDYDVFSNTPQKTARRIERKLDKKFKGNYFVVKEAIHKGTYKVMSRIGDRGIVDISKSNGKVPTVKRSGIRLATLQFQKKQIKISLKNKEAQFRHAKDKEVRSRIKIAEMRKRKVKKPRKKDVSKKLIFNIPSFKN